MKTQMGLFTPEVFEACKAPPAPARRRGPKWTPASNSDTSLEAAHRKARRGKAQDDYDAIIRRLSLHPSTDQELAQVLNLAGNTIRPRRGEAVKDQRVEWSGERRPTGTGGTARVWRLTAKGREYAAQIRSDEQ